MEEKNLAQEKVINDQIHTAEAPPERNLLAKKPLIIGIAALILLALVGLFLFLWGRDANRTTDQPASQTSTLPPGTILFEPADTILLPGSPSSADITVNTGGNMVGGVVISLKYNPQVLRNVTLEQIKDTGSAISYALEQTGEIEHDTQNGTIVMTLKLPEGSQGLSGRGTVARLTFSKANFNVAIPSNAVTLLPNTNFITVIEGAIPVSRNNLHISFSK